MGFCHFIPNKSSTEFPFVIWLLLDLWVSLLLLCVQPLKDPDETCRLQRDSSWKWHNAIRWITLEPWKAHIKLNKCPLKVTGVAGPPACHCTGLWKLMQQMIGLILWLNLGFHNVFTYSYTGTSVGRRTLQFIDQLPGWLIEHREELVLEPQCYNFTAE